MSFLDKLKGKGATPAAAQADGVPDMTPEPTLAEAMASRPDVRARENAAAAPAAAGMDENEGLPSVNRRKGGNRLVTLLGFVFILGAGAAMFVAVNGDKGPKKKDPDSDRVASNLPPLMIPETPQPLNIAPRTPPVREAPAPIAVQQQRPTGKEPLQWYDRKMGGNLLAGQGNGQSQPRRGGAAAAAVASMDKDGAQPATLAGQPGGGGGSGNTELATRLEGTQTRAASASLLADRNYLLTKGTSLDCALETALDSTVPGLTTCRLTRDIYSDNGQVLLLDRGSQLVGEYQGGMRQGQVRLFVLWTRVKTPNGVVVSLNSPGTDALGRSGIEGWVDNHFLERFGAAILMSFIKDAVTAIANRESSSNSSGGTTNVYGSAASGGERVIEKILDSTVNIPPTLIKNQGDHIQIMVARDLDFSGVYGLEVKQ